MENDFLSAMRMAVQEDYFGSGFSYSITGRRLLVWFHECMLFCIYDDRTISYKTDSERRSIDLDLGDPNYLDKAADAIGLAILAVCDRIISHLRTSSNLPSGIDNRATPIFIWETLRGKAAQQCYRRKILQSSK